METINYIYTKDKNGNLIYNEKGKKIAEIQLKCNLENLEIILQRYTNAIRNNKHPRTIGKLKNDYRLYLKELKNILQGAKDHKTKLSINDNQINFFNFILTNNKTFLQNAI